MNIKVIACDVYGTILATDDPENCLPPRQGFIDFARRCGESGIILVTTSDASLVNLKIDLTDSGVPLEIFADFFQIVKGVPKEYQPILERFGIKPEELFVFGDKYEIDIQPAIELGAKTMHLVEYRGSNDNFDWGDLDLESL